MSYVVHIWQQPEGVLFPSDIHGFVRLLETVRAAPTGQNPRFLELARRLTARHPCICSDEAAAIPEEEWDTRFAWSDGPLDGRTERAVYSIGLNRNLLDEVRPFVIAEANALGLNVMDDQAAEAHLADGSVISPRTAAPGAKGIAALQRGDTALAAAEFSRLAALRNPGALYRLGELYLDGRGVERSRVVAGALWALAAHADPQLKPALDQLAARLSPAQREAVRRLARTMNRARQPLDPIAAHFRAREAAYQAGRAAAGNDDYVGGRERIEAPAEDGHAEAQFLLGLMYSDGRGVAVDKTEAARWYRLSAEGGHAWAQCNLSGMLADGNGIARDENEAAHWYRLAAAQGELKAVAGLKEIEERRRDWPAHFAARRAAAERGEAEAQFEVGEMFLAGKGSARDAVAGVGWVRRAAEAGHAPAQLALAQIHYAGKAVPRDLAAAVRWFRRASSQDSGQAQYCLGALYLNGDGVPQDRIVGLALQLVARRNGFSAEEGYRFQSGELGQVHALLDRMIKPGQLLATVDAHLAQTARPVPADEAAPVDAAAHAQARRDLAAGATAVGLSLAAALLGIALKGFVPATALLVAHALALCVGACGAWRIANGVGSSGLIKFFYAVLMAMPIVNFAAGPYLLLRAWIGRRALG